MLSKRRFGLRPVLRTVTVDLATFSQGWPSSTLMRHNDVSVQQTTFLILMCLFSELHVSHSQRPDREAVFRGNPRQFPADASDGRRLLNNKNLEVPNLQYAADNTSGWSAALDLSVSHAENVNFIQVPMIHSFVGVEGVRFVTAGEEYKVVGWNTYTLIDQAAHLPIGSFDYDFSLAGRRQVTDMLDNAVAAGFNTVRTW